MKNLPEFKALIERYESITEEEIIEVTKTQNYGHFYADDVMGFLTGYGHISTCTLCKAIKTDCVNCVYYNGSHSAAPCADDKTYHAIFDSATPTELLTAIRNRAAYMRTLLPEE